MNGGEEGQPGDVLIEAADGTTRTALKDAVHLQPGDRVRVQTGGGGGFGNPRRRSPERVRTDVLRGYVSPEAARDIYGWDGETA
jgi:N-methylhydantoinase B